MKPVTAVIIGAGDRGRNVYGKYALEHPEEMRVTAVAEPDPQRRREFQALHGIADEHCFSGYEELLSRPRLADAAFICTQDGMHYQPALLAKRAGYHILLEKPISNTPEDCVRIWKDCSGGERGQLFAVGHVLRYTPFFQQIKAVLDKFFSFYMRGKQSDIMKGKQCALLSCLEETDVEIGNESVRAPYLRAIELLGWNSIGEVIVPGVYEAGAIKSTDGEERAARLVELI